MMRTPYSSPSSQAYQPLTRPFLTVVSVLDICEPQLSSPFAGVQNRPDCDYVVDFAAAHRTVTRGCPRSPLAVEHGSLTPVRCSEARCVSIYERGVPCNSTIDVECQSGEGASNTLRQSVALPSPCSHDKSAIRFADTSARGEVRPMAPKARVTQLTAIRIERAQDALLEALEDGVFCHSDQARLQQLLRDALTSASKADLSAQIAVGGMRGSIDGRHHQDLVNEFLRLDALLSPLPADDLDPLDAA